MLISTVEEFFLSEERRLQFMPPNEDSPVQIQMAVAVLDGAVNRQYHGFKKMDRRQSGRRRVFVQTDTGSVFSIELDREDNAHTVKRKMQMALNVPTEENSLTLGDTVLKNDLSTVRNDAPLRLTRGTLQRSSSTPCFPPIVDGQLQRDRSGTVEILGGRCCTKISKLVKDVIKAVERGVDPIPVRGGLGGAYYFRNYRGGNVAIVKPTDEEPFAPNNPKGFVGKVLGQPGLKRWVRVGETGIREVAAYLLDHDHFANVPPTVLVKITHSIFNVNEMTTSKKENKRQTVSKIASFQQFVPHDCDASDYGTSSFPVAAVHRIGILDIRILNTDRHAGNLLVKNIENVGRYPQVGGESVDITPIDHGFCLPENLEDPYFEWLHWPQASIPFSEDELEYICKLDAVKDVEMLRRELPMVREACLRVLMLCTIFLKKAAEAGLCLAEIGAMMSREFHGVEEESSELEEIYMTAVSQVICKLEVDQETSVVKSEGEDNRSELSLDEEHLPEQFQFDMEYEDDEDFSYMNSVINGWVNESCGSFNSSPASMGGNGFNKFLNVPDVSGVPPLFPRFSLTNSERNDLQIPPVSNGTTRNSRGGIRSPFASNCPSPRTPRGGCRSPLSKLEEISPLEENEMQEPVPGVVNAGKGSFNQKGPLSAGLSASLRCISYSDRNQGCSRQGASAAGAVQSGHEQGAVTGNYVKVSDMSEQEWALFIECFQELLPDAFASRKIRSSSQRHRLGTSCQF